MKPKIDKKLQKTFKHEIEYLFDLYNVTFKGDKTYNLKTLKETLAYNLAILSK